MNRFGISTCVVVFLLGSSVVAQLNSAATIAKSEAILKNLQDGKFADVFGEFNPVAAKAIPDERLRAVWDAMSAQFGALKSIDERRSGELKGLRAAELILTFEKERVARSNLAEVGQVCRDKTPNSCTAATGEPRQLVARSPRAAAPLSGQAVERRRVRRA